VSQREINEMLPAARSARGRASSGACENRLQLIAPLIRRLRNPFARREDVFTGFVNRCRATIWMRPAAIEF
jgi:hypothetical protein